jgi:hypothetical protein
MKRRMYTLLIILLLTLVLAAPASATNPTAVSGTRWINAPPQNVTCTPVGRACIIEVDMSFGYEGDLVGTSVQRVQIPSRCPCEAIGLVPLRRPETYHVRGTFAGDVLGLSGTFDYIQTPQNGHEGSDRSGFASQLTILSGSGDLAGLQGVLDVVDGDYLGWVSFEPQP